MPKPIVVNTRRQDPYKNFRFRVLFGGKVVAAANNVTGVGVKTAPSLNKGSIITMTNGVTSDAGFAEWASRFAGSSTSTTATRRPLPRSLVLRMRDETGKVAASWRLSSCSITAFQHTRSKKDVAIEAMKLQPVSLECC
jgi:hypothetical protein